MLTLTWIANRSAAMGATEWRTSVRPGTHASIRAGAHTAVDTEGDGGAADTIGSTSVRGKRDARSWSIWALVLFSADFRSSFAFSGIRWGASWQTALKCSLPSAMAAKIAGNFLATRAA